MNLQENIQRIKEVMGIVSEQQYIQDYGKMGGDLLDFCGYRAIEAFEETKGMPTGQGMGDNYFESNFQKYENLISKKIDDTIGLQTFKSFPPKLKMQIWSFMYNGTDASQGTNKFIAGLAQAINMKSISDPQQFRSDIMKNPQKGIDMIVNFKGDYNQIYRDYLNVLDLQYQSTAKNNNLQGSYDNSWKFRPTDLDRLYNQCPKQSTKQTSSNNVISIIGSDMIGFKDEIANKTSGTSLDLTSIQFDMDKLTFSVKLGRTPVYKLVLAWNEARDNEICQSCKNIIDKNSEYRPQVLKDVKWENGKRIANLIVLYPKK